MSFAAVLGITLVLVGAAALGIALVTYLSSLAKSAYELKIEMRREMENGMKRVEAETNRQTKFARTELMSEIERCRAASVEDIERRHADQQAATLAREAAWAAERDALTAQVAALEERVALLEIPSLERVRALAEARAATTSAPMAAASDAVTIAPPVAHAKPLALENFDKLVAPIKIKAR